MLDVTLRDLEYVAVVAEELNFTRAAARLHMAQPALSQAILRIERRLGAQLFNRTSRSVTATPAGAALAADALKVLSLARRAVANARQTAGVRTTLRVHVSEPSLMTPRRIMAGMRASATGAAIQQTTLPQHDVVEQLCDGRLSIAIGSRVRSPGVRSQRMGSEAVGVLMSLSHPLAEHRAITFKELVDYPLLGIDPAMSGWDQYVGSLCASAGVTPTWSDAVVFGTIAGADILVDDHTVLISLASIGEDLMDRLVWKPLTPAQEVGWWVSWSHQTEDSEPGRLAVQAVTERDANWWRSPALSAVPPPTDP